MKKYKIDLLMLVFCTYIFFIIINDYLTFFLKDFIIGNYVISFIITAILFIIIRKKIKIEAPKINKNDIFIILLIISLFLIRVAVPDSSFDVLNYHIMNQTNPFLNNTSFNFFPARWINTFSFPLGDRLFYFFRLISNYRLGIIFNYIVLFSIYFQTKRVIKKLNFIKNDFIISTISFFALLTEQIISNASTYYTDLISIPLFLELLLILLDKNNFSHYYTLFLASILVSLKLSNAFFILLIGLIYLIQHHKDIKIRHIIIGIIIFIFPLVIYMINNYLQTKNPFFPFYNAIFKSPYLNESNWIEEYYGPKSLKETLLWPIYVLINPRRAYDTNIYFGRITYCYISSLILFFVYLIKCIKNKQTIKEFYRNNRIEIIIVTLYLVLLLLWGKFMMGYIRYALILEVLGWVTFVILIKECLKSKKYVMNVLLFIVSCCLGFQVFSSTNTILFDSDIISWRYSILSENWKEKYRLNSKKILSFKKSKTINDIDCIGIADYNLGYAIMTSKNIPIISLNESYNNDYGKSKYEDFIKKCDNIYTITTKFTKDRTNQYLKEINYEFDDDIKIIDNDFLDSENELLYIKIKKINKQKEEVK